MKVFHVATGGLISVAALLSSGPASGQQTASPLVPVVSSLKPSDTLSDASDPRVYGAFVPLHLSLTAGLFPLAPALPECASREEASGNSVNGFAIQRYTFLRLTPNLVLHGFSSAGCPVDAGAGGGITYSAPIAHDLWFVPSAGFYALPAMPGDTPLVTTSVRMDVVKRMRKGRVLTLGLGRTETRGRNPLTTLNFGGSF
jgi:hypothetical protein